MAPTQHRIRVKEYYKMAEAGLLSPSQRVELLNGLIIDMSPIGPFHGGLVNRLSRLFNLQSKGRWVVSAQNPLHLDDYSEPEPDLMLLKPAADDYMNRHPAADDVFLLIEVSDTSLDYDREEKLPSYARAGVPEVWIVDLNEQTIEVYREPAFLGYSRKSVLHPGDQASPQTFSDITVNLTELFRR